VFLLDDYVAGLEYDGLPTQEVYNSYVVWCGHNGYRPMNAAIRHTCNRDQAERLT
jgi:hypothetical protein